VTRITAGAVKFYFERYKALLPSSCTERVKSVEIVDPHRRSVSCCILRGGFCDVLWELATGAGWIVPKKYLEAGGSMMGLSSACRTSGRIAL